MAPFERRYDAAKRRAIYEARFVKGLSYKRIARAAADGDLADVGAFEIGEYYIGELCRKEEKRRAGKTESALAEKPHRDAIEVLRRRLIAAADAMANEYERSATKSP